MKRIESAATLLLCVLLVISAFCCSHDKSTKVNKAKKCDPTEIDLYMVEVAYAVNKNWKLTEQIELNTNPICSIVFKIMPTGEIKEIAFTDKSGNDAIDTSALLAIKKTNPVHPFPKSIKKPFIRMGLRFSPNGVR